MVLTGDKTDQYARVLAACRGVGYGDPSTLIHQGACTPYVPDSDTFIHGYTSPDIHSPAYFFLTGWMSWPLQRFLHMELITAARLTGAVWLWLGMVAPGLDAASARSPVGRGGGAADSSCLHARVPSDECLCHP